MSFDLSDVLSGVITLSDLNELLRELDLLEESLYKTDNQSFIQTLENSVIYKLSGVIKEQLDDLKSIQSLEEKKKIINELRNNLKNIGIIRLEIGVEPTEAMIKKIHKWIKENVDGNNVIDLTVDREIIAGARVSNKGVFGDFSVKKKWSEIWEKVKPKSEVNAVRS